MEGKKISFGFMKTKKADKPSTAVSEEKKEYIECVEEQSIKVVGGEEVTSKAPLVIPMKPNTLVTVERLKEIAEQVESALEEPEIQQESLADENVKDPLAENETLDQMAVRELMQGAKKVEKPVTTSMAITTSAKPTAGGEKESTLDDYEAVPVQDFGMAMLRGMGWTPGKDGTKYKLPELRPKGLGLGADKVIKKKPETKDGKSEELAIVKNAPVKVTAGKYSGYYGKTLGRATRAQKKLLATYISQHPEILKVNTTCIGRNELKEEWEKLAESLNAVGCGDYRSGQQWKRYWIGLKHKVKERVIANGDISCEIDKRVWSVIQSEYKGFSSNEEDNVSTVVTSEQQTCMLNYLLHHKYIITSNGLNTRSRNQISFEQEWEQIAKMLNAKSPEASKSGEQWKMYWQTLKIGAKARAAARKKYIADTHNPTDCPIQLSEVDWQVLTLIGQEPEDVLQNSSESPVPGRRLWVPKNQLDRLLSYIIARPGLVRNEFKSSIIVNREWQKLANYVNSTRDGIIKNPQQWRRYWVGLKHKAKAQIAESLKQKYMGNPADPRLGLSEFHKKILQIMDCKATNNLLRPPRPHITINTKDNKQPVNINDSQSSSDDEPMHCEVAPDIDYKVEVKVPAVSEHAITRNSENYETTGTESNEVFTEEDNLPLIGSTNEIIDVNLDNSTPADNPVSRQINRKNRVRRRRVPRYRTIDRAFIAEMERRRMASDERISAALETIAKASMIQAEATKTLAQAHLELAEMYFIEELHNLYRQKQIDDRLTLLPQVVSLDEDNGRVMIDIPVKKETVSLSEFMMHAVTKTEYDKESKVINADSFEEYKKKESTQKTYKQEEKSSSSQRRDEKDRERRDKQKEIDNKDNRRQRDQDSSNGRSKNRERRDSSSSEDRTSRKKKKDRRRHSSSDSMSLSEDDRKHKSSKHKSRRGRSRSRSNSRSRSPTPERKRDIDKKRKGKKKKRDRDRSPNYKKYRK